MRGIDRASHTKKHGVKDNFLGLQALTKNLMARLAVNLSCAHTYKCELHVETALARKNSLSKL